MYSNKNLKSIGVLKHYFGIGQDVYYASLIPSFDWFENQYKIETIIEPIKTTITHYTLMPDSIMNSDKVLTNNLGITNIIRKYILNLTLEIGYDIELIVYEDRNKEIIILSDTNKIVNNDINKVLLDFIRLVFTTHKSINYNSKEFTLIYDSNYKKFESLYNIFKEEYPDELIKIHSTREIN